MLWYFGHNIPFVGLLAHSVSLFFTRCVHFHVGKWSEMQQGKYYEDLLQTCKTTQLLNPALKQVSGVTIQTKHYSVSSVDSEY